MPSILAEILTRALCGQPSSLKLVRRRPFFLLTPQSIFHSSCFRVMGS